MPDGTLAIPSFGPARQGRDNSFTFDPGRAEPADSGRMLAVVAGIDTQAPPVAGLGARSAGTWFHLISIAIVAAATVSVFFGIGFPLLLQEARGARHHAPVVAGDTLPATAGERRDGKAAPPVSPGPAPAADVAAAFVRLPPAMAATDETDTPRPSLPEHAAAGAAGLPPERSAPPVQATLQPTPPRASGSAPAKSAAASPQPPASAPARANAPARSGASLPAAEVAALLARGDQFLRAGDVASARLFYERAADAGDGQAALREAATFDSAFLANAGLRGTLGDPVKARWWYARAHQPEPGKEAR